MNSIWVFVKLTDWLDVERNVYLLRVIGLMLTDFRELILGACDFFLLLGVISFYFVRIEDFLIFVCLEICSFIFYNCL